MHTTIESSLGDLTVVIQEGAVMGLYFPHHWYRPEETALGPYSEHGFTEVARQLNEYLAGERRDFDLPLRTEGTAQQLRVWELIAEIPYGETAGYGALAKEFGGGITPQEVGAAVGRNPISIIIPCHRVVGANGELTGYAGGLRRKRALLDLEQDVAGHSSRLF